MKIRVFENMCNSVFRVVINTECFSENDIKLMCQFGEPEIDVGGDVEYEFGDDQKSYKVKTFGSNYVRIMHGFPLSMGFDIRDYEGSVQEAMAVGTAWKEKVKTLISSAIDDLRSEGLSTLPTEEVYDNI